MLNLIINGIPSIHQLPFFQVLQYLVLNLIINGIPSILGYDSKKEQEYKEIVLNLIINGIPSIL